MQELKECFSTRSIPKLQEVLSRMPKEESAYHMKRCIDSGLWVPDAKAAGEVQSSHLNIAYYGIVTQAVCVTGLILGACGMEFMCSP